MIDDLPRVQLRPLVTDFFADPSGEITDDQILIQTFTQTPCVGRFAIQRPRGALWLRFSLTNPNDRQADWVLAFMENAFDEMTLYEQTSAGLVVLAQNGRTLPVAQRSNTATKAALPVTLAPQETKVVYARVSGTMFKGVTPVLVSADMFDAWATSFDTVLGVLLGLMGLLIVLSLILFRQVVAQFYKYYTLYMIAAFLFIFVAYSWQNRLFDLQLSVMITVPVIQLVTGLSIIANIQYCRVLLQGGKRPWGQQVGFAGLTLIAVVFCGLAVINPWEFAMPNNLMLFVSPIILLIFAARRLSSGLPQVLPLCGSLICLISGLAIANYYFLSPPPIVETSSVLEVMFKRAGTFSYAFAIIGEAIFVMLAISRMLNAMRTRGQNAIDEVARLRHSLTKQETENAQTMAIVQARERFMEDALEDSQRDSLLHADGRLEEQARKIIHDHVSTDGFGTQALASDLGISERTLNRRMKDALNVTPAVFIRQTRLNLARDLILLRHYSSVAEVAYATGFSSVSHFAKLYRVEFHETPRETFKSVKPVAEVS